MISSDSKYKVGQVWKTWNGDIILIKQFIEEIGYFYIEYRNTKFTSFTINDLDKILTEKLAEYSTVEESDKTNDGILYRR